MGLPVLWQARKQLSMANERLNEIAINSKKCCSLVKENTNTRYCEIITVQSTKMQNDPSSRPWENETGFKTNQF